jgi:hypothetical protein
MRGYRTVYQTDIYLLKKVYDAAVLTDGCSHRQHPGFGTGEYHAKLQKCGNNDDDNCTDCTNIRCGSTRKEIVFCAEQLEESANKMLRKIEEDDDIYASYGLGVNMGDDY